MPPADVVTLARELIAIDSVNPALAAGGAGEGPIAAFVAEWLGARGLEVEVVGRDTVRPSVIALKRGSGGGRALLMNGHLDTVGVAGYAGDPFEARLEGGRLFGRGSYDMKSGLAAAMVAAAGSAVRGDVVLALVADEEFGSIGTEDVLTALGRRPDGAIVVEPTGLRLTVAHRGFAWYRVEVEGVAAHGSQPELGVDAIARATELLLALRGFERALRDRPGHPLLGSSAVRVATIEGGTDAATVADRCVLTVERRTLPGEHEVHGELERVLAGAGVPFSLTELVARPAFEVEPDAEIVRAIDRAGSFARRGDPWWTDAGLLAGAGIPTVLIGVDGGGAHAAEEWVELDSLDTLTATLARVIADFCG